MKLDLSTEIIGIKLFHIILIIAFLIYSGCNITKLGIGEILVLCFLSATLLIGKFTGKKDLSGMILAGILFGACIEYITEFYWIYSLKVYIYKDISLFVIIGWGYNFTCLTLFSNFIYKYLLKKEHVSSDPRILLTDTVCGLIWLIPNEFLGINIFHLWTYNPTIEWNHFVPVINYPVEALIGSMLLALIVPSFIRMWANNLSWSGSFSLIRK